MRLTLPALTLTAAGLAAAQLTSLNPSQSSVAASLSSKYYLPPITDSFSS